MYYMYIYVSVYKHNYVNTCMCTLTYLSPASPPLSLPLSPSLPPSLPSHSPAPAVGCRMESLRPGQEGPLPQVLECLPRLTKQEVCWGDVYMYMYSCVHCVYVVYVVYVHVLVSIPSLKYCKMYLYMYFCD